ncbi:hypothetical protein BGX20_008355 [Mortierella sp. AD010]|nr:hypothetical protein BGX20_008355 [Mortierella sp. AD010]
MSRERSNDSMLSTNSSGTAGVWNIPAPAPRNPSALNGSLFGAAGSATAARMKIKTDSPLFDIDDDVESRETEELLASKDPESDIPSTTGNPSRPMASSVPISVTRPSFMIRGRSDDSDAFNKPKLNLGTRKSTKAPSVRSPTLPAAMEEPVANKQEDDHNMGQELRPVYTSARDREIANIYPSTDEESELDEGKTSPKSLAQSLGTSPPPLPPRPQTEQELGQQHHEGEAESMHGSICTQVGPTIHNREQLIDRLMDIICGQPESGAHRFRIMTIQMATELLIEFVFTKGVAGKEGSLQGNNNVAQQAAENQLGEERLQRLALAEEQFRERVQKGIRKLERKKRGESTNVPPLGILTGKVERSLTESKLGIDRQIVNIIAESSTIYGPDKNLDKEPDLDPDQDLMILFGLDPEYTSMKYGKTETEDEKTLQDQQPTAISFTGSTVRGGRRARIRSRIKARMQGNLALSPDLKPDEQISRPPQSQLSSLQRLEAMVIRYIKWLHILIQCRQLLCRKAVTPAMALLGAHSQPTVATTSYFDNPTSLSSTVGSPTVSITESSDPRTPLLERRPSDLMSVGSSSTVVPVHKGLQKALATTATTAAESVTPESGLTGVEGSEDSSLTSSPTTAADSASNTTTPSVSSSLSSLSSSVLGVGLVSATLSQPASGTASGRIIGSRTLLSAAAALEAAANSSNHTHTSGAGQGSGSSGTHHPFINDMLTNHLDPLSASVSEAIRKSSAKIKKSVVDPLATNTNNLFKYSSMSVVGGHHQQQQEHQESRATTSTSAPVKGFYRPPTATSDASSVVSLMIPGSAGIRRSLSSSSSSTFHSTSVAVPASADGGYVGTKSAARPSVGRDSEDHSTLNDSSYPASRPNAIEADDDENFLSILDVGHPGHQMDDQVFKILETLGLATSSVYTTQK